MKLVTLACVLSTASAFVAPAFKAPAARSVQARTTMMAEKSKSLPFLPRPENLDGTIPGDVGAFWSWFIFRKGGRGHRSRPDLMCVYVCMHVSPPCPAGGRHDTQIRSTRATDDDKSMTTHHDRLRPRGLHELAPRLLPPVSSSSRD